MIVFMFSKDTTIVERINKAVNSILGRSELTPFTSRTGNVRE